MVKIFHNKYLLLIEPYFIFDQCVLIIAYLNQMNVYISVQYEVPPCQHEIFRSERTGLLLIQQSELHCKQGRR